MLTDIEEIFPHLPLSTKARLIVRGLAANVHPSHALRASLPLSGFFLLRAAQVPPEAAAGPLAHALVALLTMGMLEIYVGASRAMNRTRRSYSLFDKASAVLAAPALATIVHLLGWVERPALIGARGAVVVGCACASLILWISCRGLVATLPRLISHAREALRRRAAWRAQMTSEQRGRRSVICRIKRLALREITDPEEIEKLRRMAIGAGAGPGSAGAGPPRI